MDTLFIFVRGVLRFRRIIILSLVILFLLFCVGSIFVFADSTGDSLAGVESIHKRYISSDMLDKSRWQMDYVPGEIVVKFKPSKVNLKNVGGKSYAKSFAVTNSMKNISNIENNNIAVLKFDKDENMQDKIAQLKSNAIVEYAEPNYIYHTMSFNDTYSGNLWGLQNVDWYQAMNVFSGDVYTTGTVVAVIDAGVAYDHPDLYDNMWNGSSCVDENGDAQGACIYGYDFIDDDVSPYPVSSSHGTHVAGIIASVANNNKGVMGVNPNAKIMAIRVGDDTMTLAAIIKGINFAKWNGARIINASWGSTVYSSGLYEAIETFENAGGLFVTAAGNDSNDNDLLDDNYPCNYTLDNIICVAATESSDNLAVFSNYGNISVDVAAPGENIYSTMADITSTVLLSEDFESTDTGEIAFGWVESGTVSNRGVYDFGVAGWKVLYGDLDTPYAGNIDSTMTRALDTSNSDGISIEFFTQCDTEYNTLSWTDYMVLEVSTGNDNFTEIFRWDESVLDSDSDSSGTAAGWLSTDLASQKYGTTGFEFRFRWVTNNSDNDHDGCLIDDIEVVKYNSSTNGEPYAYMNGTSMAAPYVAGLTSLGRSMVPNLSPDVIKSVILRSGDTISSLSGKILTSKRINVNNTLLMLKEIALSDWSFIYSSIGESLSANGIFNNFSGVTNNNVTGYVGLYFAKTSGDNEIGRITFGTGLDLTDIGVQNFLSGELMNSIGMGQGQIWFNPGTGFIGKVATLTMRLPSFFSGVLSNMDSNYFAVRAGSGGVVTGNNVITNVYSSGCNGVGDFACLINLDVSHFTQFDVKPILRQVHIQSDYVNPSYASSGYTIKLSFTGSENLTGVFIMINDQQITPVGFGTSWYGEFEVTGGTASSVVTFAVNYQDMYYNSGDTVVVTTDMSSVTVDNTSPSVPHIVTLSHIISGSSTNIEGTGDIGDIIHIKSGSIIISSGLSNGSFSISTILNEGDNLLQAYAVNIMGKISSGSNIVTITKDSIAPNVPVFITSNQTVNGINIVLSGTAESGSIVIIYSGSEIVGSGVSDGNFSIEAGLNEGENGFTAKARDIAYNFSVASNLLTITKDSTAPIVPVFGTVDQVLNATGKILTGVAETGSIVIIYSGSEIVGSGNSNGNFSIEVGLNEGENIFTAKSKDNLGNLSSGSNEVTITKDSVSPLITITSHINNQQVTGESIVFVGVITESNISSVIVDGVNLGAVNSFSQTIGLSGGVNSIIVTGIDIAGNVYSTDIDIVRVNYVSVVSSLIVSGTSARVMFNTDLLSDGYVKYGIDSGSLDLVTTGILASIHSIDLDGLDPGTVYYFRVYATNNGYTGGESAMYSFETRNTSVNTSNITGTVIVSGSIQVGGATQTGAVFTSTGILTIVGSTSSAYLQIPTSGFVITSTLWNGLLLPPSSVVAGATGNAGFGETGMPLQTEGSIIRTILLTIEVGGSNDSLVAVGGYFTVSFVANGGGSGDVVNLYRSEDGTTWIVNTPDPTCVLDSGLVCVFRTDHLSYFTFVEEATSGNAGGAGGGDNGVNGDDATSEIDNCPNGDDSGDLYDGDCSADIVIKEAYKKQKVGSIAGSPFGTELNAAYLYAYGIGITTMDTIYKANVEGNLIRAHMAKMIVAYAMDVLGLELDETKSCVFNDIRDQSIEMKSYIKLACQLGLMGVGVSNFMPNDIVTRAQFGTILSRALYGTKYEGGNPYYIKHLAALKQKGIITISNPRLEELRGYVMLMLMRADK